MTADVLTGCPAEEHVRFAVAMLSVGADKAALEDMHRHFDLSDDEALFLASSFARWAHGVPGIEAVRGWRQAVDGALVVECRSSGGRDSELRLDLSPSGRLGHARIQPALDGVDITAHRTSELTADQRAGVFDVFDAAYREADHSYLAAQLGSLQSIGVAWRGDSVVGFSITGHTEADLPIVGGQAVGLNGMSCTRPDVRRGGVMFAMMGAAVSLGSFPRSLGASRLATPATLNAMVRLRGMFAWPTEDDPLALYTQTSPSQRTVGRALAELLGASDFDDEHLVCIGRGRPVGFPVVEPEAPPEQWAAFECVDRGRGDTLLYVNWVQPPPPAWFD